MNIYALDKDPRLAARYHNDRHVAKQILETSQIMCSAHIMLDGRHTARSRIPAMLRPSHITHPCVKWAMATTSNYRWLGQLLQGLCEEYTERTGKIHLFEKTLVVHDLCAKTPLNLPVGQLTPFVQTLPDKYKSSDPVEAYRRYYMNEKKHLGFWSAPAVRPPWFIVLDERMMYELNRRDLSGRIVK